MANEKLDRLLTKLNNSGLQQQNIALYEVIAALIRTLRELNNEVTEVSSTSGVVENITKVTNIITSGSGKSSRGGSTFLGIPGPKGVPGATGAQGPPTIGPMGINGKDGRNAPPIPGPRGERGLTGIQGPAGSPTVILGRRGEKGRDGYPIPLSGSGSSSWELAGQQTAAGAANYDFTGLGSYTEILILTVAVTRSISGVTSVQVSSDNGSTFHTTSGDYVLQTGGGADVNQTLFPLMVSNTTSARTAMGIIYGFNKANIKPVDLITRGESDYITPAFAMNAIRVLNSTGGTLNAGTIYVYGRR